MDERQLRWVHKNRLGGRPRYEAIGPLSQRVAESPLVKAPAWRRNLLAVLEDTAGVEFLEQAEVVRVRLGVLTLQVRDPALLYQLRLQWEQRLLQVLQSRLPAAGIRAIRFVTAPRHRDEPGAGPR